MTAPLATSVGRARRRRGAAVVAVLAGSLAWAASAWPTEVFVAPGGADSPAILHMGRPGARPPQAPAATAGPQAEAEAGAQRPVAGIVALVGLASACLFAAVVFAGQEPAMAESEESVPAQTPAVAVAESEKRAPEPGSLEDFTQDFREGGRKRQTVDIPAPVLSEEELTRRRTTPSVEVKNESWYLRGKNTFVAKCAGCHPGGTTQTKVNRSLFWDDLTRGGYTADLEKIRYIIRYGKNSMPGFAKDCSQVSGYLQCGVITPLSDETIQNLQDFVINRANAGWRGRG